MHYTDFEKQVQSIFQVKIKEDYISKLFQSVYAKTNHLETEIQALKSDNYRSKFQEWAKQSLKSVLNQLIQPQLDPMAAKMSSLSKELFNCQVGQQNMNNRFYQELKKVEKRFRQSYEQERANLRSELRQFGLKSTAIQRTMNDYIQATSTKQQRLQCDIQSIWEVINVKQPPNSKKKRQQKHSIFYKLNQGKENSQKQDMFQGSFRKINTNARGSIQQRRSVQKEESRRQSTTVEYASLLLKIQAIQKKIDDSMSKGLFHRFKNNEEQSVFYHQSLQKNEDKNQKVIIQKKKPKLSNSVSRLNRSSINSRVQNESEASYDESFEAKELSKQLRKVNEKLAQMKFKYTLLQQNHEIILNKISRVSQLQSAMNSKIQQIQKVRIDLSTINEINMRFRKIQASYQQQDYKYVLTENYSKDLKQVRENIKDAEAKINKLANKDEVKEAFIFIQTKIKEMALVLTDKFQSQKEGAINKIKEVKCLTCDKDCDDYPQIRRSLNTMQNSRNIKISNEISKLKRKPRASEKNAKTEGNQIF